METLTIRSSSDSRASHASTAISDAKPAVTDDQRLRPPPEGPSSHELSERLLASISHSLAEQKDLGRRLASFTDALVPFLASLTLERPGVVAMDFDLHLDEGRLKATGKDVHPDDLAWLEFRIAQFPRLAKLAGEFNQAVSRTFGDAEKDKYWRLEPPRGWQDYPAVPDLDKTVDRDVGFMSLLRQIRDDGMPQTFDGMPPPERFDATSSRVLAMIITPETYKVTPGGFISLNHPKPLSKGSWVA